MNPARRPSLGLLGRLLAILLAMIAVEFVASTFLYERSSRALVQDDEAHRLAEHLAIARRLIAERPWAERPKMAEQLTTGRYDVRWHPRPLPPGPTDARLEQMRHQVVSWEPSLADGDLRLQLVAAGREARLSGALGLPDGTWLKFGAAAPGADDLPVHRILLALLPAATLLLVGTLLFRRTLRPMNALASAVDRMGRGGVDVALPEEAGPREVRRLIRAFSAMQTRIQQLISDRTQALAAVGHDLRTPLARLQLRIDAIQDRASRAAFEEDVAEMEAMVSSLLAYLGGESDPEAAVRADVAVLAATVVDDATDRGGTATYAGPDHCEAKVRTVGLKRALANLVDNAIHYGGRADVTLAATDGELVFAVADDGPGIPESQIEAALSPFSRLDPARGRNTKGLGLGLAIVRRAAATEGGSLRLVNRPEGGLCAELRLPRR